MVFTTQRGVLVSCGFSFFSSFSSFWPLGHFHWRRFIGGRDFVSHFIQTSFTLFEKHFKLKTISSENQLKKRKDNALNRAMKWIRYKWTIKTTRQQYSTSSRFRGFARPCFFMFLFFFDRMTSMTSRLKVPAEAFCSCPSNKAEQQFKITLKRKQLAVKGKSRRGKKAMKWINYWTIAN